MNEKPDANAVLSKAMGHVQQLRDAYDEVLRDFDVLLTPANPRAGSKHPDLDADAGAKMEPAIGATLNTCQFNATGRKCVRHQC
jgi:amidase